MKRVCNNIFRIASVVLLAIMNSYAWAQDSSGSSSHTVTTETTSTTTTEWYAQPWVWIVGGAVFIIILIALLRGNSRKDTTEVNRSTTVVRDDRR